jgi:helix-turn-helix, Psq domain
VEPLIKQMTISEAAQFHGVSNDTIRRAVKRGKMKATRRNSDGAYLVDVDTSRPRQSRHAAAPMQAAAYAPTQPSADAAQADAGELHRLRQEVERLHRQYAHAQQTLRQFLSIYERGQADASEREAALRAEVDRTRAEAETRRQEMRDHLAHERQERRADEERHQKIVHEQEERHRAEVERMAGQVETVRLLIEEAQHAREEATHQSPPPAPWRGLLGRIFGG